MGAAKKNEDTKPDAKPDDFGGARPRDYGATDAEFERDMPPVFVPVFVTVEVDSGTPDQPASVAVNALEVECVYHKKERDILQLVSGRKLALIGRWEDALRR